MKQAEIMRIQALNYPLKSVIFFRAALLALTHLWAQFSPEQPCVVPLEAGVTV